MRSEVIWLLAYKCLLGLLIGVGVAGTMTLVYRHKRDGIEAALRRYFGIVDDAAVMATTLDESGHWHGWGPRLASSIKTRLSVELLLWVVLGLVFLGMLTRQYLPALCLSAVIVIIPLAVHALITEHKRWEGEQIDKALPDALSLITSSVGAGLALPQAIANVGAHMPGPLGKQARVTARQIVAGKSIAEALQSMANRTRSRYLRLFVAAAEVHLAQGGNLVAVLKDMSAAITRIALSEGELRAKTAGARREAQRIAIVPFVLLPICLLAAPDMFGSLFTTGGGIIVLVTALVLAGSCAVGLYKVTHREV